MKIEDFRPIRSQDSAPIKFDWLLMQESDWIIWTNQKITLMIFWLVKNGKDWNPAIPLVKHIFLVPDHIWPKTIKGQPALTHVIRNYVLLLVVPPLCLWWVTHIVTKALRLKILPGQQLPLFPTPPTLLINLSVWIKEICTLLVKLHIIFSRMQRVNQHARPYIIQVGCPTFCYQVCALDRANVGTADLGYSSGPCHRNDKHIFTFCVISPYWYNAGSWNPSSNKTRTYLFYIVNIMAADVLAT